MLRPQLKNSELCQSHTQQQSSLTHFNPPLVIYQALRNHLNKLMNECAEAVSLTPPEESPGFLVFEASASVPTFISPQIQIFFCASLYEKWIIGCFPLTPFFPLNSCLCLYYSFCRKLFWSPCVQIPPALYEFSCDILHILQRFIPCEMDVKGFWTQR